MRIPARYAPLLFSALLSSIMAIVSAFVLFVNQGFSAAFPSRWLTSCLTTWPVAFPTVAVVAPLVRKLVARVTA